MGRFEVQGIVSGQDGSPLVQLRQVDDDGNIETGFQVSPDEARSIAHNILEAATNAVYEASLVAWAHERDPEHPEFGIMLIDTIRKYRADRWGSPDSPEDWNWKSNKKNPQ